MRIAALTAPLVLALLVSACSPTPSPTRSVTVEEAAAAYIALTDAWAASNTNAINAAAEAADADASQVGAYASVIAESYRAFADRVAALEFPEPIQPAVEAEIEASETVVGLATQVAADPSNIAVRSQLSDALARLAERSANVEAMLGISN